MLGVFGEFHPDLLETLGIDAPIAGFELYLDAVPPSKRKGASQALEASDLQPVRRDFAFLLDGDVAAGDVLRAAVGADRALIAEARVFDVFTGQGVPDGKKSLAIEVTLQPRDKTLTDAEIEAVAAKIVAAVTRRPAASCAARLAWNGPGFRRGRGWRLAALRHAALDQRRLAVEWLVLAGGGDLWQRLRRARPPAASPGRACRSCRRERRRRRRNRAPSRRPAG